MEESRIERTFPENQKSIRTNNCRHKSMRKFRNACAAIKGTYMRSRFLAQPRVLQWDSLSKPSSLLDGRQTGLTKSENGPTGRSILSRTTVLPSTGDLTIPTIRRSCCQGELLVSRIVPRRADHSAFGCLWRWWYFRDWKVFWDFLARVFSRLNVKAFFYWQAKTTFFSTFVAVSTKNYFSPRFVVIGLAKQKIRFSNSNDQNDEKCYFCSRAARKVPSKVSFVQQRDEDRTIGRKSAGGKTDWICILSITALCILVI